MLKTNRRSGWGWARSGLVLAVAAGTVAAAVGPGARSQGTAAKNRAAAKAARGKAVRGNNNNNNNGPRREGPRPRRRPPGQRTPRTAPAKAAGAGHVPLPAQDPAVDGTPLAASYYPAVQARHHHARGPAGPREGPLEQGLRGPDRRAQGAGAAEHLQGLRLRRARASTSAATGPTPAGPLTDRDWRTMVDDLQAAYQFLVDRHNRGELNLAKLGVVGAGRGGEPGRGLGVQPGGASRARGGPATSAAWSWSRPLADGEGSGFARSMPPLAPRIPILLMAGERDKPLARRRSRRSARASRRPARTRSSSSPRRSTATSCSGSNPRSPPRHPVPRRHRQAQGDRVGAPLQPDPRRLHRHRGRPQRQARRRQGQGQGEGDGRQGEGEGQGRRSRPRTKDEGEGQGRREAATAGRRRSMRPDRPAGPSPDRAPSRATEAPSMEFLSEDPTYLAGGLGLLARPFLVALRVTQQGKYLVWAGGRARAWRRWCSWSSGSG